MAERRRARAKGGDAGRSEFCSTCTIRHSTLCSALTREEIVGLSAIATRKKLSAGQTHVYEGDVTHSFANVIDGMAKLVRGAEDGRSQIVGLLFPSDFIGGALDTAAGSEALYSIEAVSRMELSVYPKAPFKTLLNEHPELEIKLLNRAVNELQISREWMVLLGRKTAEERVATFLLHVAGRMKNMTCTGQCSFDLPISRSDIADYIGLTLETVSRQMSRLKKAGIIEIEGAKHITFIDEERLRTCAAF